MQAVRVYINACHRFAWPLVAAVTGLTMVALVLAAHLDIQADMARLLPESAPSVAGLDRLETAYGGQIGRLTVVLEAKSTGEPKNPRLERLADRLGERLASIEGVARVEEQKPLGFFTRHRLLYATLEDLRGVSARLDGRIRWEKQQANPLFVSLDDDPPAAVEFDDLADGHQALRQSSRFISADGKTLALFIYPNFSASELDQSKRLVDQVDGIISAELAGVDRAGVDRADASGVSYGLTGRYKKRVDLQKMLERDLAVSMGLALVLILIFLIAFVRSLRGTLVVIVPLVVGTIWTFGWAEFSFGSLNILTAFLGAVLMGLGVDYGIHLYSRFHELVEYNEVSEALVETFVSTGRANLFAALTTMVALGSLTVSEFRAFFEFGVIALGGLFLIMISYALLFPCMVLLADRYGWELTPPASRALGARIVAWVSSGSRHDESRRTRRIDRAAKLALVGLVAAASLGLSHLDFVRDFSALQSTSAPSWKLDERVNDLLGQSQTPAVVLTDSDEQTHRVVQELRERATRQPAGYTIDKVVSLATFLPEQQLAKLEVLDRLSQTLRALPDAARNTKLARYLKEVRRVIKGGRLSSEDLPESVRRPFSRTDAPGTSVVLIFPAIDLSDMDAVDDYAQVLRNLPGIDAGPGYDAISDALLLSDIINMAERDAVWMLLITVLGLVILSMAAFRRKTLVALQLMILAVAILVALGLTGLVGVDFNFMNVVVLPIWIGLGVDASFHILVHIDNGCDLRPHANTALAITAGYLTSMVGFGTLLLARHDGLFSLGQVAVVGLGSILGVNLLVQWILVADSGNQRDAGDPPMTK
jgi:predicted RND superfamily exporter protein